MPTVPTYPGVYLEEVPSGVRTIASVSTSDTAFVDFFRHGPTEKAVRITSFNDFEREFGGLDSRSAASYAIQQYFLNGGSVAWVVRVLANNATTADLTVSIAAGSDGYGYGYSGSGSTAANGLRIMAASPGAWGNDLQIAIDHVLDRQGNLTGAFNLVGREVQTVNGKLLVRRSEVFRNLSLDKTDSRYAESVVNRESVLLRLKDSSSGGLPEATGLNVLQDFKPDQFRWLGRALGQAGYDGVEPGSANWNATDGAAALLDDSSNDTREKTGLYALERIAPFIFNLICIPAAAELSPASMKRVVNAAIAFCIQQRAFFIVDIPAGLSQSDMATWLEDNDIDRDSYAAVYFPRLEIPDPLNENRPRNVGASGTLAGIYARTDATRGIWKAPAGTEASLRGAALTIALTDRENGGLNPLGVNVLRNFPIHGNVAWGARTLDGADQQASEWKYIPVRRTALFIEESLYQGLKWVVFEPNDEPLWAQIRLNVGAFLQTLFRQGAFQGRSPREAYFVKCDKDTTTQNDINLGIVNIVVGFAPLKPAEFVVLKLQQIAGQLAV